MAYWGRIPDCRGGFGILVDRDDNGLDMRVAPPFPRCLVPDFRQCLDPGRMLGTVTEPSKRLRHQRPRATSQRFCNFSGTGFGLTTGRWFSRSRSVIVGSRSPPPRMPHCRGKGVAVEPLARRLCNFRWFIADGRAGWGTNASENKRLSSGRRSAIAARKAAMTPDERLKLKNELIAARDRQAATGKAKGAAITAPAKP